jgi:branched-subunit amino acid permease
VSSIAKGLVTGFSLVDTVAAIVFGIAVVAVILGFAYLVERRLNG